MFHGLGRKWRVSEVGVETVDRLDSAVLALAEFRHHVDPRAAADVEQLIVEVERIRDRVEQHIALYGHPAFTRLAWRKRDGLPP